MLAQTITALGKLRLTQRFGKLEFVANLGSVTTPVLTGNVRTKLDKLKVEVFRNSPNGTVSIVQSISFYELLIMSTANEGLITLRVESGNTIVRGCIELTDGGSLPILDNDYYEVNFTGEFDMTSLAIYAVDFDTLTTSHNVYERISCDANSPREFNVSAAKFIAIPLANLTRLELLMSDNTRLQYEPEEVKMLVRDGLELIAIDGSSPLCMADTHLLVVNVAAALTARLTYSAITVITKCSPIDIR